MKKYLTGVTQGNKRKRMMKQYLHYVPLFLLAFSLSACNKDWEDISVIPEEPTSGETTFVEMIPAIFEAEIEETKTELNGKNLLWKQGDHIAIIARYGDEEMLCDFTAKQSGSTTSFIGELPAGTSTLMAIYPYHAVNSHNLTPVQDGSDTYVTATVTLPTEQVATPDSFDPDANISVAYTTLTEGSVLPVLTFRVLGALFKVQITENDVYQVVLSSDANMTGEVLIKQYANKNFPNAANGSSANMAKEVILHNNGSVLEPGTYYIVDRHISSGGTNFKATLIHSDGHCSQRAASNAMTLARKDIMDLGTLAGLRRFTNLYYTYKAGLDVSIGNIVYNKTTHGAPRLLTGGSLSNANVNVSVNGSGILFLSSGVTFANTGSIGISTDVVISSTDPANPALLQPATDKTWNLQDGSLVLNGIKLDCSNIGADKMFFSNASATDDFDRFGLYHCCSNNLRRYLYSTNSSQYDKAIKEIVIDHCKLGVATQNSSVLINANNSHAKPNGFESFSFTNNILYDVNGNNDTNGVCIFSYNSNAQAQTVVSWPMVVTMENNIFYNVSTSGGNFKQYRITSATIRNNVLATSTWKSGTLPVNNMKLFNQIYTKDSILDDGELSMTVGHNLGFGKLGVNNAGKQCEWVVANNAFVKNLEKMVTATESPFETADSQTGTFVLKSEYSSYGPQL